MTSDSDIFIWERQNNWGTLKPQQEAEMCLRRHWEMPEYQVRRGQWSTQTRDRWGRCRDNQSKGASHLILIPDLMIRCLISCFNSAGSPLDHFSFGFGRVSLEHCQEVFWGHILPESANQESQILLETCLNAYEKHQNSHLPCSLWERLCIRQIRWACLSVSQGWGSWINIKNEKTRN